MNDTGVFANPCAICRVKEATRLCDFIIEYNRNPIFLCDRKKNNLQIETCNDETCDLPLCDSCSHELNRTDFCPHHWELQKLVGLPEHLRKAQMRSKEQIMLGD